MKYRIEKGQVTIPVEEFNRLNDEFDKLEEERTALEKMDSEIVERIKEFFVVEYRTVEAFFRMEHQNYIIHSSERSKDIMEELRQEIRKEFKREYKKMTVKEFKKWRKK